MDKSYSKGQRLFLDTVNGTVEGIFHSIDPGHNKISLKKVISHPSGKEIDGLYHYYRNEVRSIHILEPGSYAGVNSENEASGNWNLMRKPPQNVHSEKVLGKITASDVVANCKPGSNPCGFPCRKKRNRLTDEEYNRLNNLVKCNVFIDRMGQLFTSAINDIKAEPSIGVDIQGARLGRHGNVTLISISTPSRAFLFDTLRLGAEAFDKGLRDILESEEIEKVIHNCRLISDCLHHRHCVTLTNVFDTQAADLMVLREQYGQFPLIVRSLSQCLTEYLNLPDSLIYQQQIRNGYIQEDLAVWSKRPLLLELQVAAVKSSIFLLHLRKKLFDEYMKPFYRSVDIFRTVVRDADEMKASEHEGGDNLVPLEMLSLDRQPNNMRNNRYKKLSSFNN